MSQNNKDPMKFYVIPDKKAGVVLYGKHYRKAHRQTCMTDQKVECFTVDTSKHICSVAIQAQF